MTKRRVFIAINFPESFKKSIVAFQDKWRHLPVRWIKRENLHLTLIPPSYLTDDEIGRLAEALKEAAGQAAPFDVQFDRFDYGPPGKPARMIWLFGKPNKNLLALKDLLERAIIDSGIPFRQESRPFKYPHVTIARMNEFDWRKLESKPAIAQPLKAVLTVTNIDIMESELKRTGAEYALLESVPLGHE